MSARNGKIARLPRCVRQELNERLECCEEGPQLLAWLNALDDVKKIVKENFNGVPISKQNLSEWRQGGFQEWLARRDLCEEAEDVAELASGMPGWESQVVLVDDVTVVLAARFGSLLAHWNGEVDEKFEARAKVLSNICRSVVQLQHSMHRAKRERIDVERMQIEQEKAEVEEVKAKLTAPVFDAFKAKTMAAIFGGGESGRKVAEYVLAVRRGKLNAKLDLTPADLPKPKRVKPAKKSRNRKTKPETEDNPWEESEIGEAMEDHFTPHGSNPVKVSQTDSAPDGDPTTPIHPINPIASTPF